MRHYRGFNHDRYTKQPTPRVAPVKREPLIFNPGPRTVGFVTLVDVVSVTKSSYGSIYIEDNGAINDPRILPWFIIRFNGFWSADKIFVNHNADQFSILTQLNKFWYPVMGRSVVWGSDFQRNLTVGDRDFFGEEVANKLLKD